MIRTALIFAAGRGERLRPLTDRIPKALCRVHGKPLIEHHVIRLAQAGFEHILINHAYLGGQIRHHLQAGQDYGVQISYSAEPPGALETKGAIVQALKVLGNQPFLTLSADVFTDFPFSNLALPDQTLAHLVLTPLPLYLAKGDFTLDDDGHVSVCDNPPYTFGNIACFHPSAFASQPVGRAPLGPFLKQLIRDRQVTGEVYRGQWINVGSTEQLQEAETSCHPTFGGSLANLGEQ